MLAYVVRRLLYALPILVGVNLLTFLLFFYVSSPEDMARRALGEKRVTDAQVAQWLSEHGYDLPKLFNPQAGGFSAITQTIFWQKNAPLFLFRFGESDRDRQRIGPTILRRMQPSLSITVPTFVLGLVLNIFFAMIVAFYRGTYIDVTMLVICVLIMSISTLFYIIGGQFLIGKYLRLVPISGFESGLASVKFLVLPILIGLIGGLGGGIRYNRTLFLEEINKDYIRTARAKGLSEGKVLFKHGLKNAMIPILTSAVLGIPFLIMGSVVFESFFGIPGLGSYLLESIQARDFAVVRAMVYFGSVLYIIGLIMVDVSYTIVDPRIRLR